MSKFIQFNVVNSAAVQPLGPINPIMVNTEDITTFVATGLTGANAKTLIINLSGRYARAAAAAGVPGRLLTLTFSTSVSAAVNPTVTTGQPNPFVEALAAAMKQDVPGVAVYQLGNDQSTAAAAPNGVQMYIRTAVFT
jgi:hypothetical protein|tara:strand:+ start:980 stop:1393 length:414 start_codon:yes stop_codon:yes gene_type:complete